MGLKDPIYLDANASMPLLPEISSKILSSIELATNPSSIHSAGQRAKVVVERAREALAQLISCSAHDKIVFTSGATESNNAVISSLAIESSSKRSVNRVRIVTSAVEHPSVLEPLDRLIKLGAEVEKVLPSSKGELSIDEFLSRVNLDTTLVSVMFANNETGVVYPVAEITKKIRQKNPNTLIHCDAVQALGKVSLSFSELGVDFMSLSGHKVGACSGVGALIVRDGISLEPLLLGGPQEKHLRAGTENILGIASFGMAAGLALNNLGENQRKIEANRALLRELLLKEIEGVEINSEVHSRLPNTISLSIDGINGDDLVVALDLRRVFVSSGAACASGKPDPSHVLLAMGFSKERARSTIRISLSSQNTTEEIVRAASVITETIVKMRS